MSRTELMQLLPAKCRPRSKDRLWHQSCILWAPSVVSSNSVLLSFLLNTNKKEGEDAIDGILMLCFFIFLVVLWRAKTTKKKKPADPDETKCVEWKEDPKSKFKFQLDEKIEIPDHITEFITENHPEQELVMMAPDDQPDQEDKIVKRKGVDLMTMEEVKELVWESFRRESKLKMLRYLGK